MRSMRSNLEMKDREDTERLRAQLTKAHVFVRGRCFAVALH
jgi:hypothetical protein